MSETTPPYDGAGDNPLEEMMRRPPLCGQCGKKHWPEEPHDPTRLEYQSWFRENYGRAPTYRDAIAHCGSAIQEVAPALWEAYGIDPDQPADMKWPAPKKDI